MPSNTQSWIVGSAAECDLVASAPTVSSQHCRLTWDGEAFWLEDLDSTNGTIVNGQRITVKTRVSPAHDVKLGKQSPLPWPELSNLADRVITIGGAPDNDIVFDYPMVSAHHARILIFGDQALLEDLNSTNGTAINSRTNKIDRTPISTNDMVYLGSFEVPAARLLDAKPAGEMENNCCEPSSIEVAEAVQPAVHHAERDDYTRIQPTVRKPAPRRSLWVPVVMQVVGLACSILLGWALYRLFSSGETASGIPKATATDGAARSSQQNPVRQPIAETSTLKLSSTNQPNLPDAKGSAARPPDSKPLRPIEEVIAPYEQAMVWLAVEPKAGIRYAIGTGWLAEPQTVVTTATTVRLLAQFHDHSEPIYAFHGETPEKFIAIRSLRTHPLFDAGDPTSDVSRHHDLGTITLNTALSVRCCQIAPTTELAALRTNVEVMALGFLIPDREQIEKVAYDLLHAPQSVRLKGTIVDTTPLAADNTDCPRLELKLDVQPGMEGGPVFNSQGHVIGVLWRAGGMAHAIPSDRIGALFPVPNPSK